MNVSRGIYSPVEIKWDQVTLPLKAGTPVNAGGLVANDGTAVGLVPEIIRVKPVFPALNLLVAGDVDLEDVEAEAGITFTDACKQALTGINFWTDDVRIFVPTPEEEEEEESSGGIEIYEVGQLVEGEMMQLDKKWSEIKAAVDAGKFVVFRGTYSEETAIYGSETSDSYEESFSYFLSEIGHEEDHYGNHQYSVVFAGTWDGNHFYYVTTNADLGVLELPS